VIAKRIQLIDIQSAGAALQPRPELLPEDSVSQCLRLADLTLGRGDLDEEAFAPFGG
jgi:hypothetical protein